MDTWRVTLAAGDRDWTLRVQASDELDAVARAAVSLAARFTYGLDARTLRVLATAVHDEEDTVHAHEHRTLAR